MPQFNVLRLFMYTMLVGGSFNLTLTITIMTRGRLVASYSCQTAKFQFLYSELQGKIK